jgi:hypothetical protein
VADTGERLPDFNARVYDPIKQRSLTNIVERRLRSLNSGLADLNRRMDRFAVSSDYAPINHTHSSVDITDLDLSSYLTGLGGSSITELGDVTLTGPGYLYFTGSGVIQTAGSGGSGGIVDAYSIFRDTGGNETTATGSDFFRFRSASAGLTALVINNDVTYGDHLRLTIVESGINHDALANFVSDEHVAHSSVSITAGVGLTGGGDLTATRTLDVGAGEGIAVNADDVALSFGTLTPQGITGGSLLAFWDGANHRARTWTDLQTDISITESQISDFGTYGDLTQAEVISGGWRSSTPFSFGDSGIDTSTTPGLAFYSSGIFTVSGDAQTSLHTLRVITTDATPTPMTTNGSGASGTNTLQMPDNSAWAFCAHISGRHTTSQDACAFKVEGMIDKAATPGSVVVAGYAKTILGRDDGTWDVTVSADLTHGALQINVTGANAKTIRWAARVEITQVRY